MYVRKNPCAKYSNFIFIIYTLQRELRGAGNIVETWMLAGKNISFITKALNES